MYIYLQQTPQMNVNRLELVEIIEAVKDMNYEMFDDLVGTTLLEKVKKRQLHVSALSELYSYIRRYVDVMTTWVIAMNRVEETINKIIEEGMRPIYKSVDRGWLIIHYIPDLRCVK